MFSYGILGIHFELMGYPGQTIESWIDLAIYDGEFLEGLVSVGCLNA